MPYAAPVAAGLMLEARVGTNWMNSAPSTAPGTVASPPLALWKAAIFCEAIYTRWLDGQRPGDEFGPTLEAGVPRLLEAAQEAAGRL